jgi:hypothetical protein
LTLNKILHLGHSNQVTWEEIVIFVKSQRRSQSVVEIATNVESPFFSGNYAPRPANTSLASDVSQTWKDIDWKNIVTEGMKI